MKKSVFYEDGLTPQTKALEGVYNQVKHKRSQQVTSVGLCHPLNAFPGSRPDKAMELMSSALPPKSSCTGRNFKASVAYSF